jgi:hypothetical protein
MGDIDLHGHVLPGLDGGATNGCTPRTSFQMAAGGR